MITTTTHIAYILIANLIGIIAISTMLYTTREGVEFYDEEEEE